MSCKRGNFSYRSCIMQYKLLFFTFLLSCGMLPVSAQVTDTAFILPHYIPNCTITNMELADSFSATGDSINASRYYLKTDPYFFISSGRTVETAESGYTGYLLTKQAKLEYTKLFTAAFNKPRAASFIKFRSMLQADQLARHKLSSCADSFSCSMLEKQMALTDAPHFEYLYNYVQKYGWADYVHGAMFAEVIAMHDGPHMQYYLPFIKKAVTEGKSCARFYYNLLNRAKPSGLEGLKMYTNKIHFDISYILKGSIPTPAQKEAIIKAVQECGPIKAQHYVYESASQQDFTDFMGQLKDKYYWNLWDYILVTVARAENKQWPSLRNIPYFFNYSKTVTRQKKLTLYLVY